MSTITPTFSGEMQLAAWSESHTGGCKVTFWLPTPQDLDAFRALTVRKGNHAGHRFMAVLVEVGDDEQPVQRETQQVGYGQQYAVLHKSGWFNNPKVASALGVPFSFEPEKRTEAIKQIIYDAFETDSLTHINPEDFKVYCKGLGLASTLPPAFGAA
jgi:hypothetical protein